MLNEYRNENTEIIHRVTFLSICPDLSILCRAKLVFQFPAFHPLSLCGILTNFLTSSGVLSESQGVWRILQITVKKHYQLTVTWKGRGLRKDGPLSLTMWPSHIQLRIIQEFVQLSKGQHRNWVLSGRKIQSALAVTTQLAIISAMGKV